MGSIPSNASSIRLIVNRFSTFKGGRWYYSQNKCSEVDENFAYVKVFGLSTL